MPVRAYTIHTFSELFEDDKLGLSAMEVGMLSASYLPGRFRALTVSSLFSVVPHFSSQDLSRLYLKINRVNLSI